MRILLINAYEASSHKAWAKSLMKGLTEHRWEYLSLPARHFAWRLRGNAMSFAFDPKFKVALQKPYDLVIATSMTDCVGLKAFCPDLQAIPWLLYFHENQFDYPASQRQQGIVEMQMVTLYSALAADLCVFNSVFNKETFFSGARDLLTKLPDYVSPDWLSETEEASLVLPVPLDSSINDALVDPYLHKELFIDRSLYKSNKTIQLVWSARWEFDKGPDRLLAVLQELENRQVNYQIAVIGEQFRSVPPEFEQLKLHFSHRISQFGYVESRSDYLKLLSSSDMVLSTALHEFQGLAVLEAVALGCIPILPNRQVYAEIFSDCYLYESHLDNVKKEAVLAVDLICQHVSEAMSPPSVERYFSKRILPQYGQVIQSCKN